MIAGGFDEPVGTLLERIDVFRVGRRLQRVLRVEGARELLCRVANERQFFLLAIGDKARERHRSRDLRQLRQAAGNGAAIAERGRQYLDGIRIGVGVAAEIKIGRNRFRFWIAQIDRVEVKTEPIEQRQAGDHHDGGAGDDRNTVALKKTIDRRQRGKSEFFRLARRFEQADQRRQDRDAGCESDQHAETGDQAQFGHTAIIGGQKREKTGGGRARGQRQRRADMPAGREHGAPEIVVFMALRAVAHAVLNPEIDADADEQHGEIDRD